MSGLRSLEFTDMSNRAKSPSAKKSPAAKSPAASPAPAKAAKKGLVAKVTGTQALDSRNMQVRQ